ncbi:unnamed protein product, partial [Polarella glacialis]
VSADRLRESRERCQQLLEAVRAPPAECRGSEDAEQRASRALVSSWHVVFGEGPRLPVRSDDHRLPVFLRLPDGPSGFAETRMPKSSAYLSWASKGIV